MIFQRYSQTKIFRRFYQVIVYISICIEDTLTEVNLRSKPPYSVQMRENTEKKKLRIRTLFT